MIDITTAAKNLFGFPFYPEIKTFVLTNFKDTRPESGRILYEEKKGLFTI
jgi:hypothetical protein